MKRPRCEWCGRPNNLERFGDDAWICRVQSDCEKHWPDVWPAGTRGVPAERTEGHFASDLTLTSCDDLELRRRAAAGDEDAVAEMARRNRVRVGQARFSPSKGPSSTTAAVGFVSTGSRRTGSGTSVGRGGAQVA